MKSNSTFFIFAFMSKKRGKHFATAQKKKKKKLFFSESIVGDVFGENITGEFNPVVKYETIESRA